MSFYLDSSVVVSAISAETSTARVLAWLTNVEAPLTISDWVVTEASAAVSQKLRMKLISSQEQLRALAAFEGQFASVLPLLPITRAHFRRAARMVERVDTALRAGDALHLALVEDAAATLVTLDKGQARAGDVLSIKALVLA